MADTGRWAGTARRTAATRVAIASGSCSIDAPPPWRFTVLAGQPKFRSMPSGCRRASAAAFSAMLTGSEPSNCARTGTPARVRLPCRSSGM